jgi:hypothetical protein
MTNSLAETFRSILDIPMISRTRRNHGLEHATLHILAKRYPKTRMGGHSDSNGFWILGDVPVEAVESAANDALARLQRGGHDLAVHPGCGTNYATSGVVAGLAASLVMLGGGQRRRDRLERLPLAITLATVALVAAQPLGLSIQRQVTTSGDPQGLEILEVKPVNRGRLKACRVTTDG